MKRLSKIFGLIITISVGSKIMREILWEHRKEILKGKSLPFKFIWYISHYLSW